MIIGKSISLREVCKEDAETILVWENNPDFWEITENQGPFSLQEIEVFISESRGLQEKGQVRYMILDNNNALIGAIDLFGYRMEEQSAGIGILIAEPINRRKGYASDALLTLTDFLKNEGTVRELKCIIYLDNIASINLFLHSGFVQTGLDSFKGKGVKCFSKKL